jgi:MFS family permease
VSPARSWRLILSIWLTLGVAFGLYFSFPVFYVALLEEFGWSRGVAAGAFSLSAIVQGVLSPLVGALVDRVGPRRVMLGGGVLLGVSYLLGGWITTLWHLYLVTGVLAAGGACAVGWVPCAALLSRWFARRQGSVMGLAFSGMGVGILVLGPLAQWLITNHGWRQAYFLIGAGTIAALVPLAWFGIRDRPPAPVIGAADSARAAVTVSPTMVETGGIDLRGALGTRAFWALFLAYLFTPLAVFPVVTHQVAFAVDQGWPRQFVAGIFGLTGFMSVVGRIVFGFAADRIGRAQSASLSYACTALGTLALLSLERWHHGASLYVYALLFGAGFGARGPIITAMASELFPGRQFGRIYGALSLGNGIGGALGPWLGGVIFDVTGSYRVAFLLASGFCVLGAACFWVAARPSWRRG